MENHFSKEHELKRKVRD